MKYKVYLTKSCEVAGIIATAYEVGKNGINSIGFGISTHFAEVPEVYRSENVFCCVVRYNKDADVQPYQLIIA